MKNRHPWRKWLRDGICRSENGPDIFEDFLLDRDKYKEILLFLPPQDFFDGPQFSFFWIFFFISVPEPGWMTGWLVGLGCARLVGAS